MGSNLPVLGASERVRTGLLVWGEAPAAKVLPGDSHQSWGRKSARRRSG